MDISGQHGCESASLCGWSTEKNGGQQKQALGRSRGGFSTKVHVNVDALGNPLRFRLTGGQRHDITQAADLVEGYASEYVIADTAYDAQDFLSVIAERGAIAVIPPRKKLQDRSRLR